MWMFVLAIQVTNGFRHGQDGIFKNREMELEDWELESNGEVNENMDGSINLLGFTEMSNNISANMMEKRQQHSNGHSCSCDTKNNLTFLGEGVYPRNYPSRVCDWAKIKINRDRYGSVCRNGGQCKEHYHNIIVLKARNEFTVLKENRHDVPRNIMDRFYFDPVVSFH